MLPIPEMRLMSDLATFEIAAVRHHRDQFVVTVRGCAYSDHPRCSVRRMQDSPYGCEYLLEVACTGVRPVFTPFETQFSVPVSEVENAPQEAVWLSGISAMPPGGMMRKKTRLPELPHALPARPRLSLDTSRLLSWAESHLI